jgi:hypothetical protein
MLYHTTLSDNVDQMVMRYKTLSSNDLAARSVRSLIMIMCVFAYNNLVNTCSFEIVIVTRLITPDLRIFDGLSRHAPRVVDIYFRGDSEGVGAINVR